MSLRDNWTRDAQGDYVDWTRPPYRNEGSGIVTLLLEGEDAKDLTPVVHHQRVLEYTALSRRALRK